MNTAYEVNFDGLVGPTHNYSGLSAGNLAATSNQGAPSSPRKAALQGLEKMRRLHSLGIPQAVLPPHRRPHLGLFTKLGLAGTDAEILKQAARSFPELLTRCYAASSMWAANCATVTASSDASDGKVHFTPANQMTNYHRAIEAEWTAKVLREIFNHETLFVHHSALPFAGTFGDEGAANHCRFCTDYGGAGLNVFFYGRDGIKAGPAPKKFPPRQTRAACEAIGYQHGIAVERTLYVQQNPDVIDAGIFHNDVIATANRDVFFYHELAFVDTSAAVSRISQAFELLTGQPLRLIEVKASELSLEHVVTSYLFNSQIVSLESNRTLLLCPSQCKHVPRVQAYLERLKSGSTCPFDKIAFVDVGESMRNGGGPACLRLRIILTEQQLRSIKPTVQFSDELYVRLKDVVETKYPDEVTPSNFGDIEFAEKCWQAVGDVYHVLELEKPQKC